MSWTPKMWEPYFCFSFSSSNLAFLWSCLLSSLPHCFPTPRYVKKRENRFVSYFSSPFCCTIILFVSGCGWCWRTGYYHGCLFLLHSSLCWRSSNTYFLGSIFVVSTCFRHGNWQSKYRTWHGVWKSQKKSHSILRAKRATFTFWVDKSSLKMPKMIHFDEFLKT